MYCNIKSTLQAFEYNKNKIEESGYLTHSGLKLKMFTIGQVALLRFLFTQLRKICFPHFWSSVLKLRLVIIFLVSEMFFC